MEKKWLLASKLQVYSNCMYNLRLQNPLGFFIFYSSVVNVTEPSWTFSFALDIFKNGKQLPEIFQEWLL